MRIAVNCRSFMKGRTAGIGRYARRLVEEMVRIAPEDEFLLYAPKGLGDRRRLPRLRARNVRIRPDYFRRGADRILGEVDVYHAPSLEDLTVRRARRVVVTIHDLIHRTRPEAHTETTITAAERQLREIVRRADRLICTSEATRRDLHRFFPETRGRSVRIYHGVDRTVFHPPSAEERREAARVLEREGVRDPFVLFVGTLEPRKNLTGVMEAFAGCVRAGFPGDLVVAGMPGWMHEDPRRTAAARGITDRLRLLGYVTDDRLRMLYHSAEVFLCPSFYEGFGFPLVEAMACGAAVVTSNVSSCPEIAGDGALCVDPEDPGAIAAAVDRLIGDDRFRRAMRSRAERRAAEFSWERAARETLAVYHEEAAG